MTLFIPESSLAVVARVTWRHWQGPADNRVLASIGQHANLADHLRDVVTPESVAAQLAHTSNSDPRRDVLIAEIEGRPVAWQQTSWRLQDGQYHYRLAGYVSPGWRRRGIGRELVRRGERRLRAVAAGQAAGVACFFSTFSPAAREGKLALFHSEGYQPDRHFYRMRRASLDDLPPLSVPAGFALRPVQAEHLRLIWDANEEAFRDHWGYTPQTEADFANLPTEPDYDPSLWQVLWHTPSGQVAGVAINAIPTAANGASARWRGRVQNLSVRRPWRQQGLGRALLLASLHALRGRGQTEAELEVDAQNPNGALRLYESTGFRVDEHGMELSKQME
jgi:mycothiol synthase